MRIESQLRERLRKIEALFAGAATVGERLAAEAALRVRARLAELGRQDPPGAILAIRSLVEAFVSRSLSALRMPEFSELDRALQIYVHEATLRVIRRKYIPIRATRRRSRGSAAELMDKDQAATRVGKARPMFRGSNWVCG